MMWAGGRGYAGAGPRVQQAEALISRWGSLITLGAVTDDHRESKGYGNWRFFQT